MVKVSGRGLRGELGATRYSEELSLDAPLSPNTLGTVIYRLVAVSVVVPRAQRLRTAPPLTAAVWPGYSTISMRDWCTGVLVL